MSLSRNIVEVVCDGPAGGAGCPDSLAWTDYGTAADLRARMNHDGWECGLPGGVDRCPRCRRAKVEPPESLPTGCGEIGSPETWSTPKSTSTEE